MTLLLVAIFQTFVIFNRPAFLFYCLWLHFPFSFQFSCVFRIPFEVVKQNAQALPDSSSASVFYNVWKTQVSSSQKRDLNYALSSQYGGVKTQNLQKNKIKQKTTKLYQNFAKLSVVYSFLV